MTIGGHALSIKAARETTAVAAKLFRGFADPTRLGILLTLALEERRVTDLVAALGTVW